LSLTAHPAAANFARKRGGGGAGANRRSAISRKLRVNRRHALLAYRKSSAIPIPNQQIRSNQDNESGLE
jgi:hypothetical protein